MNKKINFIYALLIITLVAAGLAWKLSCIVKKSMARDSVPEYVNSSTNEVVTLDPISEEIVGGWEAVIGGIDQVSVSILKRMVRKLLARMVEKRATHILSL